MATITDEQNLNNAVSFVKTLLWISWTDQDDILKIYVKSAVAKIYEMTWIDLLALPDQEGNFEAKFDGAGQRILFLWKAVNAIVSAQYNQNQWDEPDWQDFNQYDYVLKKDWQLVFKGGLPRWYENIKIKYSLKYSDFNSLPREFSDLATALALLVWNLVESQKTSWINSESVSWTTITFGHETLTDNIKALLNKYLILAI